MAKSKDSGSQEPSKQSTRKRRKPKAEAASRGLTAAQVAQQPPAKVEQLAEAVQQAGGRTIGSYRDPLGGHWHLLASLPIEKVQPTPFQRDLSESHMLRLCDVIDRMDRFLDPIIVVSNDDGTFWTPNGHHRLMAMQRLGARAIMAVVIADRELAYQILAMNTEKGHNLREKSLEVIRMARALAELDPRPEREFALEFEEAALLTLGLAYEQRGRLAGGAYHPVLRRVDSFLAAALPRALQTRQSRAQRLLQLDDKVNEAVAGLKERGFTSPYLKSFVVARINPLRFKRGATAAFDETLEAMLTAAGRFDPKKIKLGDVAGAFGAAGDAESA
jgi:ParB family transcriptional regulator, chromosome partitioning protein